MKRFAAILLCALLLMGNALAASTSVKYEGGAEKFVFLTGSNAETDSDLFDNFKGVAPGDEIVQKIRVQNDTSKKVRIYMRAEPVSKADEDFLSQMTLNVKSGDKEIFDAAASETAQLTKNTLLGTFKKSGGTDLTVTLNVPIEMGNEYMGREGTVPWTFLVEEIVDEDTPKTGDWFRTSLWVGMAAVLAGGIVFLLVLQKKRRTEEE